MLKKFSDKEHSLQYTVNIVTELSIKMNKILLNLSRQEEMLKNILQKVNFNNENDETINDDDAILEGFPIDSIDCLKDINNKLAIDKMFCKQLVCVKCHCLLIIFIFLLLFLKCFTFYRSKC